MGLFARKHSPSVIDLRDAKPAPARPRFGLPLPCPDCGGHGYLDGIDTKRRIMYQHCPACFAKWETTEAELTSA